MSMYRNAIWIVKGLKEYTQGGYLSAAKRFIPGDLDADCTGKQYMITGSNSGIGKQTALEIARRGGTVHMVCRNPKYAEDAKNELVESTKNQNIHVHILDLSNPKEVLQFASEFTTKNSETGLNVLINQCSTKSHFFEAAFQPLIFDLQNLKRSPFQCNPSTQGKH